MRTDSIDRGRRAFLLGLLGAPLLGRSLIAADLRRVPVLVYHRFGSTAADSMTVRTSRFDAQLKTIDRLGCRVVPLADLVAWRRGAGAPPLPPRAVVLTVDDGHRSQFEIMAPMLAKRGWPVTLFVYPSAISNASYAMTWPQLRQLADAPGVSVQSHTFWHPNLLQERKRLSAEAFTRFAADQLTRSRDVLQQRLSRPVTRLAWPFGVTDAALGAQAADCGYEAAVALGNRSVTLSDPVFEMPRHLMVDSIDDRQLAVRLAAAFADGDH